MFNSGIRGKRASDGTGFLSTQEQFVQKSFTIPTITSFSVVGSDDLALDPAGGQTVEINGSGFTSGATVVVGGASIAVVTFVDSTKLTFTAPAKSSGSYTVFVSNPNGGTAILTPGLVYSGLPTFTTDAGSLGTYYETTEIDEVIVATEGEDPITYTIVSGSLPSGATLNTAGYITGTSPVDESSNTYTFTVQATDAENQDSTREFSLTINVDVVTWSTPAEGTIQLNGNEEMSNVTLSATSAAGYDISYTANALPTGVLLSGNTVYGTPNTEETVVTTFTATSNNSNRTATRTVTWVVSLGDAFFNQTTLLLNADDNTFITDASDNAFTITPNGDTRPSAFSPYNTSWSNYFGEATTRIGINDAALALGTGDFEISFDHYKVSSGSGQYITGTGNISNSWQIVSNSATDIQFRVNSTADIGVNGTLIAGQWNNIKVTRVSGTISLYVNNVLQTSVANATNLTVTNLGIGSLSGTQNTFVAAGYIANYKIIKAGTTILDTCRNNRFMDNAGDLGITIVGTPKVTAFAPFTETDTSTGSGYFDGTGDEVRVTQPLSNFITATGDWTAEAWIYPLSFNGPQYSLPIFGSSLDSFVIRLSPNGTATTTSLNLYFVNSTSTGILGGSSSGTGSALVVKLYEWQHIAVVRSSGIIKAYVNGILRITISNDTTTGIRLTDTYLSVGGATAGSNPFFNGYISNARVVNGSAIYTEEFTPPAAPLTAVSNTNLLTLQSRIGYNNLQIIDESNVKSPIVQASSTIPIGTFSPHVPTGWSGYFNATGVDTYLYYNIPISFTTSSTEIIEFEAYAPDMNKRGASSSASVITPYTFGSFTTYHGMSINTDGTVGFSFRNGNTWTDSVAAPAGTFTPGTWHKIKMEKINATMRLYIDDVEYGTADTLTGTLSFTGIQIGRFFYNSGSIFNGWSGGYIRNFKITKDNVVQLHVLRENNFDDIGPFRYPPTVYTTNGPISIQPFSNLAPHTIAPDSYSVYFDGTGDYLTTPIASSSISSSTSFTIEFWAYWNVLPASYSMFLSDSNGDLSKYIAYNAGAGTLDVQTGGSAPTVAYASFSPVVNTWYHLAFVRDGTTITIYVNGSALSMVQPTQANSFLDSGSTTYIGRWAGTTPYEMNGYISNLRIVKGTAIVPPSGGPTSSLTAVSGTSLLTCQSPTVIDNSTNEFAITVNGNSQPTKFNPFGETIATDVEYSPTSHSGSIYFKDNNGYVYAQNAVTENTMGTGDFTVEMWYYRTSPDGTFFDTCPELSTANSVRIYHSSNALKFRTSSNEILSGGNIPYNAWSHIAVTRQSGTVRMFINGTQVASGNITTSLTCGANRPLIGRDAYSTSGTASINLGGYISNLRSIKGYAAYTSNFVPPSSSVTSTSPSGFVGMLLNGTSAAIQDKTGRNVLETVGNARVVNGVKKYGSGAMYFDGTGDYLSTLSSTELTFGTGDFTIEGWFYAVSSTNNKGLFQISSTAGGLVGNSSNNLAVALDGGSSRYVVYAGNQGVTRSPPGPQLNTWTHFALVRTSGVTKLYIDGTQAGADISDTVNYSASYLAIGGYYSTSYLLNGYIDDFRITKGVARTITVPTSTYKLK